MRTDVRSRLAEEWGDDLLLLPDTLDGCIVGVADRPGAGPVAIYDRNCVLGCLAGDSFDWTVASEWLASNLAGEESDRVPLIMQPRVW